MATKKLLGTMGSMAGPIKVLADGYGLTSADQIVDPDFSVDGVTSVDQQQINAYLKTSSNFKGTLNYVDTYYSNSGNYDSDGLHGGLPNAEGTAVKAGWTYQVGTAGTYAGMECEVGEGVICIKGHTCTGDGSELTSDYWAKLGGLSSAVASIFNATVEVPISGYYVLCDPDNTSMSAVHAAWNAGKAVSGLIISFQLGASIWKTYQYIGLTVTEANWYSEDNWQDFGSLAAGSETYIIIDNLSVQSKVGDYYTLETAVQSLIYCQEQTGVTYAKRGLIISYVTGENTMETKQFQGTVADIDQVALWKDFGGGGSDVETSDEPAEGGEDAFSTGGAYSYIPTQMSVDTETEGVVKLSLANAAGTQIGDEVQFSVGTGTGSSSGTIVTVQFETSPLYAAAGSTVVLSASIRSVTTSGSEELLNNIETIELQDRDTGLTLETRTVNQASSASSTTYDFAIDVSSYFTSASTRKFKIVATDDGGNTGTRNVNVTAVDVTVTSMQTLNYTASTVLTAGGSSKSLSMYKFANNASDKGIYVTTEIYKDGAWETLGTATIYDTYTHNVSIDPSELSHGAYPIRIHGEDIGSRTNSVVGTGVTGNYLHTTVMVVDANDTTPLVALRWYSDEEDATLQLYETLEVEYAVYDPSTSSPTATVYVSGEQVAERTAYRTSTYTYTQTVQDVATDGSVTLVVTVTSGTACSQEADFLVSGSLVDVEEVTTQRQFSIDMSSRSNSDTDKTIEDEGVTLETSGINWSSNGFIADDDGVTALRIAENATGTLHYAPFSDSDIETNGGAIAFTMMKKNIADDDTVLMSCISNGYGFYVTGKNVVFTTDGAATTTHTITSALDEDTKVNVAIVVEPTETAPYSGIGAVKMFFDGEEVGACYYEAGTLITHDTEITFDSTDGDIWLYNVKAWRTYYTFEQAFDNYLVTINDTDEMIEQFEFNDVMESVTAENTTKNRPKATSLYSNGLAYFVLCKNADTENQDDQYPEYLETLDGDKKTKRTLDCYAYFPDRPWQDFVVYAASTTNQGTTSSKRPIKNIKMKMKGCTIELLKTLDECKSLMGDQYTEEEIETFYAECEKNAAKSRVQVLANSLPTNIITVKVDYSESGGANNGASTELFNDLQRALGSSYTTPAQQAYTGSYTLNTSIASRPCAFFRTDKYSTDATSPSYGYFHAKGNWNEDKGDAKVFGFEDIDGYNADCLNYGDFYELVAAQGQSLDDFATEQLAALAADSTAWNHYIDEETPSDGYFDVIVLSEFCGPDHKIYRRQDDGSWEETTGTMTYTDGAWVVTGDYVNPVENYEMLKYDSFDWFQGVDSVDDLLELDTDNLPIWLQYFESRYPDDDNLVALYEAGKKVPYQLYRWLRFCQDCNQHLTEEDGTIELGGETVEGTAENRLLKWQRELYTIANVHSVLCYTVFTDYIAAVDQRSKNMMVGFYLETDGTIRMYLNHLYDGDTILGSDNDCGLTIPALLDPNDESDTYYQGHDSVLFRRTADMGLTGAYWLDSTGSSTVTIQEVADAMRTIEASSTKPFSPDGLEKYWITDRLSKWPVVVSSFDGERKYIENSKSDANYFYALHGLGIQRLRDYIKTRFLFRDGYYQTGDLYSSSISFRATAGESTATATIKVRAAKQGYFGIGVERANTATVSAYLEQDEETSFEISVSGGTGSMLYVFGAENLSMLDVSELTLSGSGFDIGALSLIEELYFGGESHTQYTVTSGALTSLTLELPFLKVLDIRNTAITTVTASSCPRLKEVYAYGSSLNYLSLAESGAIELLSLPSTYTNLRLRYMNNLTNDGIILEDAASIQQLVIEDCPNIDAWELLMACAGATGSALAYVRVTDVKEYGDGSDLVTLKALGLKGLDATLSYQDDPYISGVYHLTVYTEEELIAQWQEAFPLLDVQQQAYSTYKEYDNTEDSQRITNMDNNTGYDYENTVFTPSGHLLKIYEGHHAFAGIYNSDTGKLKVVTRLSDDTYLEDVDGNEFDPTDALGEGYDIFMYIPHFWYKGINDFKNQEKYTLISSSEEMPEATYENINRPALSECLYADSMGVNTSTLAAGTTFEDGLLTSLSTCAVYRLDVEGMKQARYPGMNNATYGSIFVDADGLVLQADNLDISDVTLSPLDFTEGDYIYRDVPDGAKWLYFTCTRGLSDDDVDVLSVDSSDLEAIEPGWEQHYSGDVIGVYPASVDSDSLLMRSLSGQNAKVGTGTSTTNTGWGYDSDGDATVLPTTTLNYTSQDFFNLASYRGKGFHCISYEQSKMMCVLSRCYTGNLDCQVVYGRGRNAGSFATGVQDSIGRASTESLASGTVNKVWGIEAFIACNSERCDYVGVNITDFKEWKAGKRSDSSTYGTVDGKWHIYDPHTDTERVVQSCFSTSSNTSGYEVARVKHGRYCDTVPSCVNSDKSSYSTCYAASYYYTASVGRVLYRSNNSAFANGGLAYAYASNASSYSYSHDGARLAFSGELENESVLID